MFTGFSDETAEFLWGIRFNNNRTWFQEHKEQYLRSLYHPMSELMGECRENLQQVRPDTELFGRVCRIYRDARRLFGRGPFKDHLWFTIERPRETWEGRPAFWFELSPDGWSDGVGFWQPKPVTMAKLRARIDRDPEPMARLTRRLHRNHDFSLDADEYKRPKGKAPSKLLEPWYRARSFSILHEEGLTELLYSRDLAERLKAHYHFLLPFFDYLDTLDGDPDPPGYGERAGRTGDGGETPEDGTETG